MKKHLAKILVLFLVLGVGLVLGVTYGKPAARAIAQGIGIAGLTGSPPPNHQVLYTFTGVRNRTSSRKIATTVHCSNYGNASTSITVEFFDNDGTTTYTAQQNVASNQTWTFSTQSVPIYSGHQEVAGAAIIDQGSGRVSAESTTVICTAQVIDAEDTAPQFITVLDLFP